MYNLLQYRTVSWVGLACLFLHCHLVQDAAGQMTKKLRIGYIPITDHLLLGAAVEDPRTQNMVDAVRFGEMGSIAEAIAGGHLDGGFVYAPLAMKLRQKGVPIKVLLLGHRDGSVLMLRSDKAAEARSLKGATIAIPHQLSTHRLLLSLYLEREKMAPTEVTVLQLPPPEMPGALSQRTIDSFLVAEPFGARAELMGAGRVLIASHEIWKNHLDCVLIVREEVIRSHHDVLGHIVGTLVAKASAIERDRKLAIPLGISFLQQPEAALTRSLVEDSARVTFGDLAPRPEEFQRLFDEMNRSFKVFSEPFDAVGFIDSQFVDTRR